MKKDKVLYLTQQFTKDMPTAGEPIDSINIEGYANCTSVDRVGDVIPMTAWTNALVNYKKNPIILAYHEDDEPIGRMIDFRVDEKGLWVKARISAAAEDVFNLIKDGVLTAFSVGFTVKDAIYDSVTDLFIIKELELLEISVVSIPCNQDSTFSLSKSFDSDKDYNEFKSKYAVKTEPTKELGTTAPATNIKTKEWNMDPKELEQLLAKTAKDAADAVVKAQAEIAAKAAEEKAKKDAEDAAINAKVLAAVKLGESGSDKLLADIEKRFAAQNDEANKKLDELQASIKEKSDELLAIQKSKMSFGDKGSKDEIPYAEKETAVLVSKILRKGITDTKYGSEMVQKYGAHVASATWELEVSTNMEAEIRRRLVVAPIFRTVQMATNVMTVPYNPEAGTASWIANTSFGTTASPGTSVTHALGAKTLNAYKISTLEYVAYEEEEDALLVLLPIIRDAMVRRIALGVDKAFLYDSTAPFSGVAALDTTSVATVTGTGTVASSDLRKLRKDLGAWGVEPSELRYIVSTETYFDLMEDTVFMTMDKAGPLASIISGQVGLIGGTPVLVSAAFPSRPSSGSSSSNTALGAVCVAPGNFIVGNQRGLRFDTQDLVETQRKVLVASLRTGLLQLDTNAARLGVSTLRHT